MVGSAAIDAKPAGPVQLYSIDPVPPVTLENIDKVPPGQNGALDIGVADSAGGCDTITVAVSVHPPPSVTTTVYDPESSPDMEGELETKPVELVHE